MANIEIQTLPQIFFGIKFYFIANEASFSWGLELAVLLFLFYFIFFKYPPGKCGCRRDEEGTELRWCISAVRWVLGFNEGTVSGNARGQKSDLLFQKKHYKWGEENVLKMGFFFKFLARWWRVFATCWWSVKWWEKAGGCRVRVRYFCVS